MLEKECLEQLDPSIDECGVCHSRGVQEKEKDWLTADEDSSYMKMCRMKEKNKRINRMRVCWFCVVVDMIPDEEVATTILGRENIFSKLDSILQMNRWKFGP